MSTYSITRAEGFVYAVFGWIAAYLLVFWFVFRLALVALGGSHWRLLCYT